MKKCSTIGATNCYFLSSFVAGPFLEKYKNSGRLKKWGDDVKKHQGHMLSYMLFMRITPLLPNWFINVTSPHVGVPPLTFILGTFFGIFFIFLLYCSFFFFIVHFFFVFYINFISFFFF